MTLPLRQPQHARIASLAKETHLESAREEGSSQLATSANASYIQRHKIKDVFFLDEEGNRCVYREGTDAVDIYQDDMGAIAGHDRGIYQARLPSSISSNKAFAHRSESGWNLPRSHEHHILNFPQEILDIIHKFAVGIHSARSLAPITSKTTRGSSGERLTSYTTSAQQRYQTGLAVGFKHDCQGDYYEITNVQRREIDASLLRTCKRFYHDGMFQLYNVNDFHFGTQDAVFVFQGFFYVEAYPSLRIQRPDDHCLVDLAPTALDTALLHIKNSIPRDPLLPIITSDPFPHFLYTIGVYNASRIQKLTLRGLIKFHLCNYAKECLHCRCTADLLVTIRRYVPFIRQFCPNLRKLTIVAHRDHFREHPGFSQWTTGVPDLPDTHDGRMEFLLRNYIRDIESLTKLVVYDTEARMGVNGGLKPSRVARETIEFIRKRSSDAGWAKTLEAHAARTSA